MYQKPQQFMISLKILLKNKKNECLIMESPDFASRFKQKYDLPGGQINDNEVEMPFHQLVDREIKEEAGAKIKYKLRQDPVALNKYRFKDGRCILYILFEAKYLGGEIKISEEHASYKWQKISLQNVKKIFHPKLAELIKNYFSWNNL
ncbi:MAG: NUDIX domain-containing protein [Patescibacteria group bacterium]|jgi:8-oxo-dGTP diphosphatase